MLKINVARDNSDTHLLRGVAEILTGFSRKDTCFPEKIVTVMVTGESWHSYPGAPGYQGFRPYVWRHYQSVKAAEAAGWHFG